NWSKFEVGNIDALTYRTVHNADGEAEKEATGISTGAIIAGVAIGAVVVHKIRDDDDDDDDGGSGGGSGTI
ncbi:MAG: hypothetical protein GY934_00010, partial [Gammaproteobacteria bacterium]|nr:hypothetical protein [Gammaproteobacteria bacterium]